MLAINLKIFECCSFDFTTFQKILKSWGSKEAERSRAEASRYHFGLGGLGFKSYHSQKNFQAQKSWIFYDLIRMCGYIDRVRLNHQTLKTLISCHMVIRSCDSNEEKKN